MKKHFLFLAFIAIIALSVTSCSNSDSTNPGTNPNIVGKWTGVYTPPLGPSRYYALTFNTNGTVMVEQNNSTTPDIANGTWTISGNNIQATYTFTGSMTGTFSIAGTYSSAPLQITGTIGTGSATSGYGTFTVSK